MGAVTIAVARPSRAAFAATSMARAAARPDSFEGVPGSNVPHTPEVDMRSGIPSLASIFGSNRSGSRGRKRSFIRARRAARSITSGSPTAATRAWVRKARSARVRTRISGPMPAGSPIVKRSVCRRGATGPGASLRSVLDLDIDVLSDSIQPAVVCVAKLLILDELLQVVTNLFEGELALGNASPELEHIVPGFSLQGDTHLVLAQSGQRLLEGGGQARDRHLAEVASGILGGGVHRVALGHGGEVGAPGERVAHRERALARPFLVGWMDLGLQQDVTRVDALAGRVGLREMLEHQDQVPPVAAADRLADLVGLEPEGHVLELTDHVPALEGSQVSPPLPGGIVRELPGDVFEGLLLDDDEIAQAVGPRVEAPHLDGIGLEADHDRGELELLPPLGQGIPMRREISLHLGVGDGGPVLDLLLDQPHHEKLLLDVGLVLAPERVLGGVLVPERAREIRRRPQARLHAVDRLGHRGVQLRLGERDVLPLCFGQDDLLVDELPEHVLSQLRDGHGIAGVDVEIRHRHAELLVHVGLQNHILVHDRRDSLRCRGAARGRGRRQSEREGDPGNGSHGMTPHRRVPPLSEFTPSRTASRRAGTVRAGVAARNRWSCVVTQASSASSRASAATDTETSSNVWARAGSRAVSIAIAYPFTEGMMDEIWLGSSERTATESGSGSESKTATSP